MQKNIAIVVNTHSSMKDLWKMFIGEFEKYFPGQKLYFFSNMKNKVFHKHKTILYDKKKDFTTQYYDCLIKIKEPYCITLNEDYIMYNDVKKDIINDYTKVLEKNKKISFIRLHKGPNFTSKKFKKNLFYLDTNKRHLYSQVATLWKTKDLLNLYKIAPRSYIGQKLDHKSVNMCAEDEIDILCRKKRIRGLYSFSNEKLLGYSNYDSYVFPYLQSVIVKGSWNFKEYKKELIALFKKYKIKKNNREIFFTNYKDIVVSFLKKTGLKSEY